MHLQATSVSAESKARVYDFLKKHPIGVLATVGPDCDPHAAAIYFNIGRDFTVSFVSKHDTKKHDNIRHNDHVMLLVYEAYSQTTAQIKGMAEEIDDDSEGREIFRHMLRTAEATSNSQMPPISKLYAGHYTAYKIKPVQVRMATFSQPGKGGYDMFETIDFS